MTQIFCAQTNCKHNKRLLCDKETVRLTHLEPVEGRLQCLEVWSNIYKTFGVREREQASRRVERVVPT